MIRGLGDYKKEDDGNKKKTTSYTGGEKSGMAVENPPDNDIESIVQQAKQGGKDHAREGGSGATSLKITLYANGFVVGDGAFRNYEAPENQQFMKELKEGNVPSEIRKQYPKGLDVGLEDRRGDTFVPPPPPKYVAYQGEGQSLGGA